MGFIRGWGGWETFIIKYRAKAGKDSQGRSKATVTRSDFLIVGGLYSVTALREKYHERVTVYTKHRLTLQAIVTEALGSIYIVYWN